MAFKRKRSQSAPRKAYKKFRATNTRGQPTRFRAMADSMKRKRLGRKAKRVTKRNSGRSAGFSVGAEKSFVSMGPALSKSLATLTKQTPPSYVYSNGGASSFGTPGTQVINPLGFAWPANILTQTFAIGTQLVTAAPTGGVASRSIPITNTLKFKIKSQCSEDAYCVIYDCTPKNDQVSSNTPQAAWNAGYSDGTSGVGGMSSTFVGAHPNQSERFKADWKILKTTKFMLAPGAQHMHTVQGKGNRVFTDEKVQNSQYFIKGWTIYSFIVVYGGPADSGTASSVVSTGSTKLIWTVDQMMSYKVMEQNSPAINQYNVLPTTIATETEMDEANGSSITYQQA